MAIATVLLPLLLLAALGASLPAQDGNSSLARRSSIRIPTGFNATLFEDDFSAQAAGALPAAAKWTVDLGTSYPGGPARWGNNEAQTYTADRANLAVSAQGVLTITPVLSAAGRWTSARIETTAGFDFGCAAGRRLRVEATLRVGAAAAATQAGIWHAFWLLGAAYRGNYGNWPSVGEIDILETLNGLPRAWHTLHCGPTAAGGPCHETNGIGDQSDFSRGEWHTVAVEIDRTNAGGDWRGETIEWFVDGDSVAAVNGAIIGDATAWEALARSKKFLLLNTAVGGGFPDGVLGAKTPNGQTRGGAGAAMEVKYVAVFTT